MNSFQPSVIALIFLFAAGLSAQSQTPAEKPSAPLKAVAVLHPTAGSKVSGNVTFTEVADGVQVRADLRFQFMVQTRSRKNSSGSTTITAPS
jgi:hypothetical protein